ncbi:MAG TPA: D-alanine--D-alanine ligase [bacterium]|nr:D-alanine--D-alanine ligase [bacterium]HPN31976.1 D-alanine--D-alanine ligase [bacterium]
MNKKIIILHNAIGDKATKDEADVLDQVNSVSKALIELGYEPSALSFTLNLEETYRLIKSAAPVLVFNLVESVHHDGRLIYLAPALLDHLKIPYTGSKTVSTFLTSNKILTKQMLCNYGILTSEWSVEKHKNKDKLSNIKGKYIIKALWEEASIGIDENSVVSIKSEDELFDNIEKKRAQIKAECFAEKYIDGREFNLALLASMDDKEEPVILPPAEIVFSDFPENKAKIVDYKAKWEEDSFEYKHTSRTFEFKKEEKKILDKLIKISKKCWKEFELRGYARIDFRVDKREIPFVLEINANPCISPDSGYVAALKKAGIEFTECIERIVADALR